jgi:O-acetyl-ADP-ribose deacetylase (regulator of RNase III)
MRLRLYNGDIFDVSADVLVCSANVFLNLSGGVGGELLSRFGASVQKELHEKLPKTGPRCVQPGEVVLTRPCQAPYKAVLHAVAVDAFYDSSANLITQLVRQALRLSAEEKAHSIALTALATGFGHLSVGEFAKGLRPLLQESFPPVEEIVVAIQGVCAFDELCKSLPEGVIIEAGGPSCSRTL